MVLTDSIMGRHWPLADLFDAPRSVPCTDLAVLLQRVHQGVKAGFMRDTFTKMLQRRTPSVPYSNTKR